MLVVAVVGGGCIARDGRIVPGDYLVSVNNESLRKVTNSQARAILRRTQLLSTDIRYNAHTNLILAEYVTES
jgi:multiple PDZ domain protein